MHSHPSTRARATTPAVPFLVALFISLFAWLVSAQAQLAGSGRIEGRVFNPATQEYVSNAEVKVTGTNIYAFTASDGSYKLFNVPAGDAVVAVSYTGSDKLEAKVTVVTGQIATHDFELSGDGRTGAVGKGGDEVVKLDKVVVSGELAGNAKALMDQRAALNAKNVVSSDNFGDITGGNMGEFVKYLPGVVIDYADADARGLRVGGLSPDYAAVTMDGQRMASAASAQFTAGSRSFDLEQASIVDIESIELNKTATASMDADAPAGTLNMRTKNAFARKGQELVVASSLSASSYEMNFNKSAGPGDGEHRKLIPGVLVSYANSWNNRFGLVASLGHYGLFNEQAGVTMGYALPSAARGLVINSISFRDSPKISTRDVATLNMDYTLTPDIILSLRTQGTHFEDDINSHLEQFQVANAQVTPDSTLTNITALDSGSNATRVNTQGGNVNKFNDTFTTSPKIEMHLRDIKIVAGGSYSRSATHYEDRRSGYFSIVVNRLTRLSWNATRPDGRSADWTLTQLSGRPWTDISSYNRDDANPGNLQTGERVGKDEFMTGYVDAEKTFTVAGLPITVAAGVKTMSNEYRLTRNGNLLWTFVGPANNQQAATSTMPVIYGVFDPPGIRNGNIGELNLPLGNGTAVYSLFKQHPEYFVESTALSNFVALKAGPRSVKEEVDAQYVQMDTRWKRMRLNLGIRREATKTLARTYDIKTNAQIIAAGYTLNTIEAETFKYNNFVPAEKHGKYDDYFLSGGVKVDLTNKLVLHVAGSQSIKRPDYNNLAGVIAINDTAFTVTVPNPELKPQTIDKVYASLEYAIEPAGTLSITAYQLDITNLSVTNNEISAEDAGYGDDPAYAGYKFFRPTNATDKRKIKSYEMAYSQQLVFLPGFAKGLSVFASYGRAEPSAKIGNLVTAFGSGGIGFNSRKFTANLRATWTDDFYVSTTANVFDNFRYSRLMVDLSAVYRLTNRYELTLSGRNINNSPIKIYTGSPDLLQSIVNYGAVWTLGVRARF